MTLPVFWTDRLDAGVGQRVTLEGDEGRHAVAVRRLRVGEELVIGDGNGRSVVAQIEEVAKNSLVAVVSEVRERQAPEPRITVVQAIPKGDRGELAVEMLTEVGVDRIVPWAASRCVAVWRGERAAKSLAKWRSTAREAAKQARRDFVPEVTEVVTTADLVAMVGEADVAMVLHESATSGITALEAPATGEIVLVVGPEGGVSPDELEALGSAGAHVVRLGESVLRTSTAGVVAAGVVLAGTDRWVIPG